jgi:hypothetical protein
MDKRPTTLPTITVAPTEGPLAGHEFLMHEPPSSLIFREEPTKEREVARAALAAVIDHTLKVDDVGDIPPEWSIALGNEWLDAWREATFPPASGRTSRERSPRQRSTRQPK